MSQEKHYWFKRRRYGWGWTPVSVQGWLVIIVWLVVFVLGSNHILKDTPQDVLPSLAYLVFVFSLVLILMYVSYSKGPKPRWRWGKKPTDNPKEDL